VSLRSKVCDIIYARSGVTQLEIARAIYGSAVDQGQVTRICRRLVLEGHIHRAGRGGTHDPYRYSWVRVSRRLEVESKASQQAVSA
jgi:hypothetical protein